MTVDFNKRLQRIWRSNRTSRTQADEVFADLMLSTERTLREALKRIDKKDFSGLGDLLGFGTLPPAAFFGGHNLKYYSEEIRGEQSRDAFFDPYTESESQENLERTMLPLSSIKLGSRDLINYSSPSKKDKATAALIGTQTTEIITKRGGFSSSLEPVNEELSSKALTDAIKQTREFQILEEEFKLTGLHLELGRIRWHAIDSWHNDKRVNRSFRAKKGRLADLWENNSYPVKAFPVLDIFIEGQDARVLRIAAAKLDKRKNRHEPGSLYEEVYLAKHGRPARPDSFYEIDNARAA